jgi:hypothetical protein
MSNTPRLRSNNTAVVRYRTRWDRIALATATGLLIGVMLAWAWALIPPAPASEPTSASSQVGTDGDVVVVTDETGEPLAVEPEPAPEWAPEGYPPCAAEDSNGCYWDAGNAGNGEGQSWWATPEGDVTYVGGEPEPTASQVGTAEPEVTEPAPWFQPCTSWLAEHGGVCQGEPVDWEFSSGETLVCGPGAKPAIDYSDDGIGWWAYCEPALVD